MTEELGRGDSSVRGIVSVSLGLVAKSIAAYGTEEQKRSGCRGSPPGEALGCFGLTEPGTGSDAGNLTTRAVRDGDDWLINGAKMFITNGTWADVALVFARTGEPGPARGHRLPGADRRARLRPAARSTASSGLRGQATAELVLDDVRVPDSARLGDEGKGFSVAMSALAKGRMSVAAGCVGIAQAAWTPPSRYAGEREQFGKPIAGHQLVQELIADIAVDVRRRPAADLAGRRPHRPRASRSPPSASKAKLFASEAAVRAANNALQVFGGYGYIDEYPVGKYLRDARVMTLYEGTSQIQKLIIGRALTGVTAF